jgi:hypothetical protein
VTFGPGGFNRRFAQSLWRLGACLLVVLGVISSAGVVRAGDPALPKELVNVDIDDKPGSVLPVDARLRDQEGRDVRLGDTIIVEKTLMGPDADGRSREAACEQARGLARRLANWERAG